MRAVRAVRSGHDPLSALIRLLARPLMDFTVSPSYLLGAISRVLQLMGT